jgi:hypothetical protein
MKKRFIPLLSITVLVLTCAARSQVEYVDPTVGGQVCLLEPTRLKVRMPNSMVRESPGRKDQLDGQIQSSPAI